jgi:hypothetical protein
MPWKLKLIDSDKKLTELEPGDIMFVDHYKEFCEKPGEEGERKHRFFSDRYLRDDYYKRDPLLICLPDGHHWCIDQVATNGLEGWQVSGQVPNLTANPSILSSGYHGWLRDGVLSDDTEGRTYDNP